MTFEEASTRPTRSHTRIRVEPTITNARAPERV